MDLRRPRLLTAVLLMMAFAAKTIWVAACAPKTVTEPDDLLARRDHLLGRTLSPTYDDDFMLTPGGIFASEWQLVTLSMTAAALTNMAFEHPETRREALAACLAIIGQTLDPTLRDFEVEAWKSDPLADLDGDNGHVGYLGHLNFVLGAYRVLGGDDRYDATHRAISHALARRMHGSRSFHIATYPGRTYTADNSVGVASLALYDRVSGESHREAIDGWLRYTQRHLLDADSGIVVFAVGGDGRPLGYGRGSAAGYNSFYLPFINEAFAAEQWERLREQLVVDMPFGGMGVREYLPGIGRGGDVDTGPLFFGVSPSATGFAIAGAVIHGDEELAVGLLRTAEMAGFTVPCGAGRCYLTAPLVGDAIVLAMRTATPWDGRYVKK